jgi:hypothetical protein
MFLVYFAKARRVIHQNKSIRVAAPDKWRERPMKLAKVNVVGPDLRVISGCYLVEDERIYTSHGVGSICI